MWRAQEWAHLSLSLSPRLRVDVRVHVVHALVERAEHVAVGGELHVERAQALGPAHRRRHLHAAADERMQLQTPHRELTRLH